MPGMLRLKGKPTKIAYKVLGVPANMKELKKTPREKRIEERLVFSETVRVR
jgi:hypothetical protein